MADLTLTTFDWVPETPRGYVRDLRATLKVGDSMVMISDASEHAKAMPVMLYL